MILADGQIPFLLHLESKQSNIAINYVCLSIPESKPQDNVKPLFSQFAQADHQLLHSKRELDDG